MHNIKSITQKDRYGNMFSLELFEDQNVPMMMMIPDMPNGYNGADTSNHPGNPKGTDTVPAWLTPGENVVNAEASRLPGNQEKIDEMNEQGRAIQQAQGGPIPSYAAGGMEIPRYDGMLNSLGQRLGDRDGGPMYSAAGDFVTDSLLDRIRRIESGGDPNAISEAGAMGQYQIMPATAAQPGYGVTPLAAEDIRDPVKSREFARQYLMGIAAANPDFTEDEVITAYHSGVGNVRKAKEGTEALGPRGQAYAGKVNNAEVFPQELIDRGVTPSDLTQSNIKSGMFSANAATLPPVPTGGQGSGQYLPDAAAQAAGMGVPVIDDIPPVTSPYSEDIILDNKGRPQAVNPNRISKDIPKQIAETFAKNGDRKMYDRRMAEYKQAVKQNEAYQSYKKEKDKEELAVSNAPIEASIADIDAKIAAAKTAKDTVLVTALEARKAELEKEIKTPKKVSPSKSSSTEKDSIIAGLIAETNTGNAVTTPPKDITGAGVQGAKENPGFFEDTVNLFKEVLGDMFSGKDIARMAINYIGSRAMGYEHKGSLNYAMKDFADREETRQTQEFELIKANASNYTVASYNKYLQTRDINDLITKGKPAKVSDYLFVPGAGSIPSVTVDGVPMVAVRDLNNDGKFDYENAANLGAVKTVDNLHNPATVTKNLLETLKLEEARINKASGANDKDSDVKKVAFASDAIAQTAMSEYFKDLNDLNANPAQANRLIGEMKYAIRAWADAQAKTDEDLAYALPAFYFNRRIKKKTGLPSSAFGETKPENTLAIYNAVRDKTNGNEKIMNLYFDKARKNFEFAKQNNLLTKGFDYPGVNDNGYNGFAFYLNDLVTNGESGDAGKVYINADTIRKQRSN